MQQYEEQELTPLGLKVAHTYLNQLDFVGFINRTVSWDEKQANLSPGQLALSVVLSTFCAVRHPLSRIKDHFASMDTQLIFGEGVKAGDLTDDAIARMLDKLAAAGTEKLYSNFALNSFTKFDIPLGDLHGDTSSIALFGTYEGCEAEEYDGLMITHGYSKDHRPDLKQFMVGNIVNSDGIPLIHQTIDGNTADCSWNAEAIKSISALLKDRLQETVYIADAKLMTMPNIELMKEHKVRFISRLPDNFHSKLALRLKTEAFDEGNWQDLGKIADDKYHASYEGYSTVRQVSGIKLRFLVVKSSESRQKFESKLEKEALALERQIRELAKQEFACEPDAQKAANEFKKKQGKGFHSLSFEISSSTSEKRPVGNPGKNPKPPQVITVWRVNCSYKPDEERIKSARQQAESFILVTNISRPGEESAVMPIDDKSLLHRYKEQHVVEIGFRLLKQPAMAAAIFLKKPERIAAIIMLLHIALLVRGLMQQQARLRLQASGEEIRDGDNRKIPSLTVEKILVLLANHRIITVKGEHYHSRCDQRDAARRQQLLRLLGLDDDDLLCCG